MRLMQSCLTPEPRHHGLLSLLDASEEIEAEEKAAEAHTIKRINELRAEHAELVCCSTFDPKIAPQAPVHVILGLPEEVLRNYMNHGSDNEPLDLTKINKRLDAMHKIRNNVKEVCLILADFKNHYDDRVVTGKYVPTTWYNMLRMDKALLTDFLQGYQSAEYNQIFFTKIIRNKTGYTFLNS